MRRRPGPGFRAASGLALGLVVAAFLVATAWKQRGMLLDPMLQSGDARTSLFAFHRHEPDRALADDPLAEAMLAWVPPAVRALYRLLVPLGGLFVATKLVQALCFGLVAAACAVLLRSPLAGPGAAAVLLFLVLHTNPVMNRLAGGLPRSFGFPCIALWIAGALAERGGLRAGAAVLASATYAPVALVLVLAEGAFSCRAGLRELTGRRIARWAALVLACTLLLAGSLPGAGSDRPHTLAEAAADPAFGPEGRLRQFPVAGFLPGALRALASPFSSIPGERRGEPSRTVAAAPVLVVAACALLLGTGASSGAGVAAALLFAAFVGHAASVAFAFRLYAPERYLRYGVTGAAIAMATAAAGGLGPRLPRPDRQGLRNAAALGLIAWLALANGPTVRPRDVGMGADGRERAALYAQVRALPRTARLLAHPDDADDVPFWGARATLIGHETIQPWLVGSWRRQRELAEQVLHAFYATDRAALLHFCRTHGVTHILVNTSRLGKDFRERAGMFEPLRSRIREVLAPLRREDLVLANPPARAVMGADGSLRILAVDRLEEEWRP